MECLVFFVNNRVLSKKIVWLQKKKIKYGKNIFLLFYKKMFFQKIKIEFSLLIPNCCNFHSRVSTKSLSLVSGRKNVPIAAINDNTVNIKIVFVNPNDIVFVNDNKVFKINFEKFKTFFLTYQIFDEWCNS